MLGVRLADPAGWVQSLGVVPTGDPDAASLANVGRVIGLVRRNASLTGVGQRLLVDLDGRDCQEWSLSPRDVPAIPR
ncbi:hypothetical protein [Pseudonocardia spinosispora]|uniref:hypothetical protein n=1 Tax=Pseudonocardia spinosispora TaxID=103441 RepID=UPI00048EA00A|nr:hypothetical protein [Pseudonocardia spinosispora]